MKQNDTPTQQKIKLRSSLDIYNRLMWDKSLNIDLNHVLIGYSDHVLGDQEIQILNWVMIDKGGDIPMHHILYFVLILDNAQRVLLWDRKTKLDRLYCSGLTTKQQSLEYIVKSNKQQTEVNTSQKIKYKISEMIEQIDDCICTVQNSLDNMEYKEDNVHKTIPVGTNCILHNLQNMPSKNGKMCKIIGEYDINEERYPVYVYDSKETVLIKAFNLKLYRRKKINIIYDMETGDPDDLFAILFLISHQRVNLRAITITPGTLFQVGAIKNLLFNKLKLKPNSIMIGSANPKHPKDCIPQSGTWKRVCGAIHQENPDGLGCDVIHEMMTKYEDCVIVTGAPLTNLYNYVTKYCSTTNNNKLKWICQGGFAGDNIVKKELRLKKFDGKQFVSTWNFNGNIGAAQYLLLNKHCDDVFDKRYLVSKNVCHGVYYNRSFHMKMMKYKDKDPALNMIYEEMCIYLGKRKEGKKLHDVLAAVAAVNRNVVEFKQITPCFRKQHKYGFEWGSKLSQDSNIFISIKYNAEEFFQTFVGFK